LLRADKLRGGQVTEPWDLAFIAMARHQLGQKGQARADLAQLRWKVEERNWKEKQELEELLREAEALIGKGKP
jgi:hypothetical protein